MSIRPVVVACFGPPALACLRSWGRSGLRSGFVCLDRDNANVPSSKHLHALHMTDRAQLDGTEGLERLGAYLKDFGATGIFCINELLSVHLQDNKHLLPEGLHIWSPPKETVLRCLSKSEQIRVAQAVKLNTLPTYFLQHVEEADSIPDDAFPVCLRPDTANTVTPDFKVEICKDRDELVAFLSSHAISRPIIVQKFLTLPNLVVHGARKENGEYGKTAGFLVDRKYSGVTLLMRPQALDPKLVSCCEEFSRALNLVGNHHFEFLIDSRTGETYFLEVNLRFGGTTAKALASGYDEPNAALWAFGMDVPSGLRNGPRPSTGKHAIASYVSDVLSGKLTNLDYPNDTRASALWQSFKALVSYNDEILSLDDLAGSLSYYKIIVQLKLKDMYTKLRKLR
jgi:hypothetical protein